MPVPAAYGQEAVSVSKVCAIEKRYEVYGIRFKVWGAGYEVHPVPRTLHLLCSVFLYNIFTNN